LWLKLDVLLGETEREEEAACEEDEETENEEESETKSETKSWKERLKRETEKRK
jgi:hypothetical protein